MGNLPITFIMYLLSLCTAPSTGNVWRVNSSVQYQEILGFGGAVTDSVGINLGSLKNQTREVLLK
jgi:hypothetical protein